VLDFRWAGVVLGLLAAVTYAAGASTPATAAKKNESVVRVAAERPTAVYRAGEPVRFLIDLTDTARGTSMEVVCVLTRDGGEKLQERRVTLRDGRAEVVGSLAEPGFLQCRVTLQLDGAEHTALGAAAVDPTGIRPALPVPDDFDQF